MAAHFIVECLDCGSKAPFFLTASACHKCGSVWREARYDYTTIARSLMANLSSRPFNMWRYRELLPVRQINQDLLFGEGGTPLIHAANLGGMLGCPHLYIKDERQNPTHSFKDRQAAVTISALKEAGVNEFVVASTGNVAISYSAYAARAGIKLWAFLTSLVPAAKMREVALYGTQVVKITGSYDQAKQLASEFARQRNLCLDQGTKTVTAVESMKTIAFEMSEQLTTRLGPRTLRDGQPRRIPPWRVPDWYIQSVSGGLGPLGVLKGFIEMRLMGWTDSTPKIAAIQADGCSPMVNAWKDGLDTAVPVSNPKTLIATLATGDPGRTYTLLRQRIQRETDGTFEKVSDEDAFRAMHLLAKVEGMSVEPAAAVAIAGLVKLTRAGIIKPTDVIVVNVTGHTLPVEETIVSRQLNRSITIDQSTTEDAPEEGLLSALTHVSIDRFPRILIADDQPDVRRLISRILLSQGSYTLYEARDGKEAVQLIYTEQPDLIILDLMMPEMDGFAVLDSLQSNPDTMDIPVIVLTAKDLTTDEKNRLRGQIQSLMQKGDFMDETLIDEVRGITG
jgi:threonine synthase